MRPRSMSFDYYDELEVYTKALQELKSLEITDEVLRLLRGAQAKTEITLTACRADDGLSEMEKHVEELMDEVSEAHDKIKVGVRALHERLKGNGKKGKEASGEHI